jgi:phospholipase C
MDPIKHVILLMLENHSFDEMLGCFKAKYPDLEGVDPRAPAWNGDLQGNRVEQAEKRSYYTGLDPKHDLENVRSQLEDGNKGFLRDFVAAYPLSSADDRANMMGYYKLGFLPALHSLGKHFTICDHWFASVPGPTWANRCFALSGTSSGHVRMHLETISSQTQPTIFDRLTEKGRSWNIFYYDFPGSLILRTLRQPKNLIGYRHIDDFFEMAAGGEAQFPDFCFIEPKYFGLGQNDGHPPHNIMKAEKLIADVYNAVRTNADLWQTTLLVVCFDEHGGFFDHVVPPAAVPPDPHREEYDFGQYGVRVPAILVSPWVKRGVDRTLYDHTSLLKYLIDKWQLEPLGERAARANSIAGAVACTAARHDTATAIRVPFTELVAEGTVDFDEEPSTHHEAMHLLAAYLEEELKKQDSPVAGAGIALTERLDGRLQRAQASVGKALESLGRRLAEQGRQMKRRRVEHTVAVASRLLDLGRSLARAGKL